jgi:C4-dicarboxylate transporter DctM subunit
MILLISTLLVLLLAGAPIGVALAGSSALYAVAIAGMDPIAIGQSFFFQLNSLALLTIPFFILAGFLMEKFGLVKRLFDFAEALLGWIPGGMGIAAVFTCIMFAAMSGSSAAMASAMSLIVIPAMVRRGYPRQMAAGIVAVGGGIGLLIPPSISLIIFGIVTETSIPRLFLAGVIPGLMLGAGMMFVVIISAVVF